VHHRPQHWLANTAARLADAFDADGQGAVLAAHNATV
jgi:hypothetical protein